MIRTQIQLTGDQSRWLKEAAAKRGVSVAQLIREGIDASLAAELAPSRKDVVDRAILAAGRFGSGRHDVARRHDRYLGELG